MADTAHLAQYKDALIVLATAGVVVPIMHRLRVMPVLGYLVAGALLGPKAFGGLTPWIPWVGTFTFERLEDIAGIAELGIVFLLFVIGLELSPERLYTMRRLVFGLGSLQVTISALAIGLIAPLYGNGITQSVLIGLTLALSSTAMVLDWLAQEKRLNTNVGRTSFAVLLLQDLAVIPLLFLVGILATKDSGPVGVGLLVALAQAAGTVLAIVVVGRLLLRPLFRLAAHSEEPELFMAAALFVAIGSGVATAAAGLSMALGGFIAGLLLAETEYRKAIEAIIEPFKGLLLGVFFISVGTRIDVLAILSDPFYVIVSAAGLIIVKALLMAPLSRLFGLSWRNSIEVALLLGPGGEFAFIVISLASATGLIPWATAGLLLAVVALTMATIPFIGFAAGRLTHFLLPAQAQPPIPALPELPPDGIDVRAVVVGAGRVGRLVSQMLSTHGVGHVLTESNPSTVISAHSAGLPVYYGDAKSRAFLERCGLAKASTLIITIRAREEIDAIIEAARKISPGIEIVSRAHDAGHAQHLYELGVADAVPETIEASLQLSEAALVALDVPTGLAIASIHERRDEYRRELQKASGSDNRPIRGLRASARAHGGSTGAQPK
jgi:CPA2 family monovalent cation:H+ antiporter-2